MDPEVVGAAMGDGDGEAAKGTGAEPGRGPRGCCVVARPRRVVGWLVRGSK